MRKGHEDVDFMILEDRESRYKAHNRAAMKHARNLINIASTR